MLETIDKSDKYLNSIWGEWMKERDKTILLALYELALRPREACRLKFKDFDLSNLTVKIRGANNKQSKDRLLPVTDKLADRLKKYLNFPRALWKGSPYLFPSFQNNCISSERWKHTFREKILKPAGLWEPPKDSTIPKYRSYTLRATKATELLNKSKDPELVRKFLGHSDYRSIHRYIKQTESFQNYLKNNLDAIS